MSGLRRGSLRRRSGLQALRIAFSGALLAEYIQRCHARSAENMARSPDNLRHACGEPVGGAAPSDSASALLAAEASLGKRGDAVSSARLEETPP